MTHDKSCVTKHAKANTCVTHGKPCVHMHANGHIYKMGGEQFVEEGTERKGKGKKKREINERKREKDKEKKGRERGRKGNLCSDSRKLSRLDTT